MNPISINSVAVQTNFSRDFRHGIREWAGRDPVKCEVEQALIRFAEGLGESLDLSGVDGIMHFPAPLLDPAYRDLFINLKRLDLGLAHMEELPAEIQRLENLEELILSYNNLSTLPQELGNLQHLKKLHLDHNDFEEFPEVVGQLTNLEDLDLSGNELATIPDDISQLAQLRCLNLSENNLNSLPTTIGALSRLSILQLEDNHLNLLPGGLGQLTSLLDLNLSGNLIQTIPEEILGLPGSTMVNLQRNPLPEDVAFGLELVQFLLGSDIPVLLMDIDQAPLQLPLEPQTLEESIEGWARDFSWPHAPHLNLSTEDAESVRVFLTRLRETSDFANSGNHVAARVFNLLKELQIDEGRSALILTIKDGLGECGDRIALCLDHVELAINLRQLESGTGESSAKDIYQLGMQYLNLETLRQHAEQKAAREQLGDMVEVYLGYQVKVGDRLELPTKTHSMLYPEVSQVKEADITALLDECHERTKETEANFLAGWGPWQTLLTRTFDEEFGELAVRDFRTPDEAAATRDGFYQDFTSKLLERLNPTRDSDQSISRAKRARFYP